MKITRQQSNKSYMHAIMLVAEFKMFLKFSVLGNISTRQ